MFTTAVRCEFCRLHLGPDSGSETLCNCQLRKAKQNRLEAETQTIQTTPLRTSATRTKPKASTRKRKFSRRKSSIYTPDPADSDSDSDSGIGSSIDSSPRSYFLRSTASPIPQSDSEGLTILADGDPENIVVASSRHATPASDMASSTTSTQIVHETPLPLSPIAAGPSTQAEPSDLDLQHLHRSRAQAMTELEASTAQVDRLRTRGMVLEAGKIADQTLLLQAQFDRDQIRIRALEAERANTRATRQLTVAILFLVFGIAAYGFWSWYNGPEFEYIRKRREEVLYEW